jgi:hypothetical protein
MTISVTDRMRQICYAMSTFSNLFIYEYYRY